jgi:CheY-like chemotaxis protein
LKPILLAEHHAPTREHLQSVLAQAGYTVNVAEDAGTALELFVSTPQEAVIVAVDLPKLDGGHLGQLVRGQDRGSRIPIIAIDKGHLGKAKGVGAILDIKANAYIADPLKPNELTAKLSQLLQALVNAEQIAQTGLEVLLGRPPVASGELRGYPLPALICSFCRVRRDGVLVVAHRELTRRVFFVQGVPVNYDSTSRQDSLPQFLLERGDLTEEQSEAVQGALGKGVRIGTALADAGVSLSGEGLLQKLRDYTREKVSQVVGMRQGRYAFHGGNEFASEVASVEIPALAPILEGARRTFPLKVFAQALQKQQDSFPLRTSEFGRDLSALGLNTADLKIAMQINGRLVLKDLLAHGRGELPEAYSLVWFLQLTGTVAFSATPQSSGADLAYVEADKIAPKKRKPLPPELVAELRDAAVKIITGSYFKVLGLDIAADTEAVERAYHDVARKFHPDSYPEFDTSEIRDLLDSVLDKLAASYRVLSIEEKRKSYLQYLLSKLDVGRSVGVNVDAEIALKRGESALKRKDWPTALRAFEEAVALNPREAEYYTHLAWATYLAGSGDQKARAKAALKLLKKVSGANPYMERAIVISAIIEGETGDLPTARKKLLKVLELNPNAQLAKAALLKVGR